MSAASLGLLGPLLAGGSLPTLDSTYGAVLLGTFFGLILYGMAIHQAYRYYRLGFDDSVYTKLYVAFIIYFYLVNHYFDPAVLFTRVWSIDNLGLVAAVLIISCQCFYARRVWLIGPQYRLLVVITVFLFLGELACATYATAKAGLLPSYSEFRELTWLFSVAFALVVVSDIILTAVLIFVLHRSRSGISRTDSMLDVLIAYTISTGLLTDIFSGLSFIFPLVYLNTNSMVYIALDIVTTKLYVNSVIGTLNFRRTLATHKSGTAGLEIGLSNLARSRPAGPPSGPLGFAAATSSTSAGSMQSVVEIKVAQDLDQFPSTATVDVPARRPYGSEVNV